MHLTNFKTPKEHKRKKSNKNYSKGKEFRVNFRQREVPPFWRRPLRESKNLAKTENH